MVSADPHSATRPLAEAREGCGDAGDLPSPPKPLSGWRDRHPKITLRIGREILPVLLASKSAYPGDRELVSSPRRWRLFTYYRCPTGGDQVCDPGVLVVRCRQKIPSGQE